METAAKTTASSMAIALALLMRLVTVDLPLLLPALRRERTRTLAILMTTRVFKGSPSSLVFWVFLPLQSMSVWVVNGGCWVSV